MISKVLTPARVLVLPEPPSANRYWRNWRGRMVVSSEAREYKKTAYLLARAAGMRPIKGECVVTFTWFRKRRAGDLDNRVKVILDSLEGACYEWDSQVSEIHAFRKDDAKNPRLEITVVSLSNKAA